MTLSTPIKVIALAGLALILCGGGVLFLVAGHSHAAAPAVVAPVSHVSVVKVVTAHHAHPARPAKPKLQLDPNLPAAVRAKLMLSREAVVFVYTGASASDRALLAQVRKGAHTAGFPFVPLNVMSEHTADTVFGWSQSTADPLVLVVRRPGRIAFQLAGPTDSQAVAQAAAAAR